MRGRPHRLARALTLWSSSCNSFVLKLLQELMMRTGYQADGTTHALLRIVAGLLFTLHGGQKLFGWFGGPGGDGGTVELASLMGLAGILELVGGALIVIGLFTRPVAFVLSGEMAVAYFMAHFPNGFWPIENRGEPAALFAFIFLFLAFNGPGPLSADALREDRVTDADLDPADARGGRDRAA